MIKPVGSVSSDKSLFHREEGHPAKTAAVFLDSPILHMGGGRVRVQLVFVMI